YARLADAGLATQQSNLTLAALGLLPQAVQPVQLILPADKPRKLLRMDGGETAFGHAFPQDPPRHHRLGKSLEFERFQTLAREHIAEQPQGAGGYDRRGGGCHALPASGPAPRPSDDRLLLRRLIAAGVADDDHAGCNSNPHLQRLPGRKQELTDLRHEIEPNPHGAFSIVFVRLGVAEIDEESVAHVSGDIPAHPS